MNTYLDIKERMAVEKLYEVQLPYWIYKLAPSGEVKGAIKGIILIKTQAQNANLAIERAIANIGTQVINDYQLLPYRFIYTGKKSGESYWWGLNANFYYVVRAVSGNEAREKIRDKGLTTPQKIRKIKKPKLLPTHPTGNLLGLPWQCEVCGDTNFGDRCNNCGAPRNRPFADTPEPNKLLP